MRLVLYHYPSCGYCARVRRAAAELGIELELLNIHQDREAHQRLYQELGRGTVPVLNIIDGESERLMPESADIIAYLQANQNLLRERQSDSA